MGRTSGDQSTRSGTKRAVRPSPSSVARATSDVGASPARKRSRIGKGLHILPHSEFDLNGHLKFSKKKDKDRYKTICARAIIPCKYIHKPTMEALNIETKVLELIDNIGWQTYFSIQTPAYIELVREFYTTFEFKKPDDFTLNSPKVVQFRLMGKEFKLSITEFNIAFGFITEAYAKSDEYLNSACDFSENFEPIGLYKAWSTSKDYDPSKSKDSFLRDPVLKYIHRFFAFTFSGRKDSAAVLSKVELYFLWCMHNKIKVNLGCWLASQFANVVSNKRPLILGSLISHLAMHENLIDLNDNNLHIACEMQPLDLHCLEVMGLIGKEAGEYYFHEPGPIMARIARAQPSDPRERVSEPTDRPSTSQGPSDDRQDTIQLQLARIEKYLQVLFAHKGLQVPSP